MRLALVGLCFVVAPVTAQAQLTTSHLKTEVSKTADTAVFTVTTPTATRATVSVSADKSFALSATDGLKKKHTVTVKSLSPATQYNYCIRAVTSTGKVSRKCDAFTTNGLILTVVTERSGKYLCNGVPCFPIVARLACLKREQAWIAGAIEMGITMLRGRAANCAPPAELPAILSTWLGGGLSWWEEVPGTRSQLSSMPLLASWETDPPQIYTQRALVTCDSTSATFEYSETRRLSAGRPLAYMMIVTDHLTDQDDNCMDAKRTKAVFWTAVAGCTKAMFYTVRSYSSNSKVEFEVTSSVRGAAGEQARRLKTLAPAVLGGKCTPAQTSTGGSVRATYWKYAGVTYIVAVNTTEEKPATAIIKVPGLSGNAQVLWEGRSRPIAAGGQFTDRFAGLGVHLYKVMPKPAVPKHKK